jgi:hydroxymethylglutaryl-CoA lyase
MSGLPASISIHEVGPREGFQFEKGAIATDRKIELVDALSETGLKRIEVTSFVSPKWVPQMADAEEISRRFKKVPGVSYNALFLNDRGLERAWAAGVYTFEGTLGTVATDVFCQKNTNKTIEQSLAAIPSRIALFEEYGIKTTGMSMMAAFGCNYEGDVPLQQVLWLIEQAIQIATQQGQKIERVRLADTMGWANPLQMKRTIAAVQDRWPHLELALHLHDTRARAIVNTFVALELGVADHDASVGGLGGCPFASHKGAAGNLVTEDLVFMCEEMGVETGVDLQKLIECAALAEEIVGHPLPSKLLRGGSLKAIREARRAAVTA